MNHRVAPTQIKAVSFDADMTLWDFEKVMRHALGITLARLRDRFPGPASAAMTVERMVEIRNAVTLELEGEVLDFEAIRLQAFAHTVAAVGGDDPDLPEELNTLYRKHRFGDIELYPDVIPVLDVLGTRYVLGMLSNGNTYPEECGLPNRFAVVLFPPDVGKSKPAPAMFLEACRRVGCRPDELLHVGDSLTSDVQGANGVGALSVWLNRGGKPNTTEIQPDYEIRSLTELLEILAT